MGEIVNAPITGTTTIWEDNQSAIAYSHDALVSEKTKHNGMKWHFLKKNKEPSYYGIYPLTKWWKACSPLHQTITMIGTHTTSTCDLGRRKAHATLYTIAICKESVLSSAH
jgi:hypothetical protein